MVQSLLCLRVAAKTTSFANSKQHPPGEERLVYECTLQEAMALCTLQEVMALCTYVLWAMTSETEVWIYPFLGASTKQRKTGREKCQGCMHAHRMTRVEERVVLFISPSLFSLLFAMLCKIARFAPIQSQLFLTLPTLVYKLTETPYPLPANWCSEAGAQLRQ